ncbi:MAG: hypothetical protein H6546_04260 [Chitinophagales bacterium]|nr:hypothetical protein [Chitinophagales bacterium]MCB9019520.1 hypothetical protein [Chitinophagales bacterium]HAE14207.1 hypothetical protein [Bacteroidota bacterium]HAE36054.1 hypothetical protein [Bacteroidota bacterium]
MCQLALKTHSQAIIVAHNHPSGTLRPSENDLKLTQKLKQVGDLIDVRLLDHIIITSESYYSFADEGTLQI